MSDSNNHGTIEISKALIGCFGAVFAAIIGGVFLLVSVGVIRIGNPSPTAESEPALNPEQESVEEADVAPSQSSLQPTNTSQFVTPKPASTPGKSSNEQFNGWVICWHGRDGYEYLIAYSESDANQGVNLDFDLTNAQGHQVEVANDSLKMCYADGEWYGYSDPNPWFPTVSYIKLLDQKILVCSDSPGCKGSQWIMLPEKYFPWNAPDLQAPKETGIHIISYKSSQ